MQAAASATFRFFWKKPKPNVMQKIRKTGANRRKKPQTGANSKNVTYSFFFHVELQLAFAWSMLFAKISDQSMSAERLSSCNTLAGGVSRVIEMEEKNPKSTQEAKEAIAAKIKATPCTYCTALPCLKCCLDNAPARRHLKRSSLLCSKLWRQNVKEWMQKRNQTQAPNRMSSCSAIPNVYIGD